MIPDTITDRFDSNDRGVSPVIGVILMVAITVILAAVIGTFVLDIGQSAGDTAPSASLTVEVTAADHAFNVSHKGGDALSAENTRVIISEVNGNNEVTYDTGSTADTFAVGDSEGFNTSSGGTTWTLQDADPANTFPVSAGSQYDFQIIDTQSQRVIFETRLTA
jgi:flagellin-like protein